jgi:hemolysin activation/secretion protein
MLACALSAAIATPLCVADTDATPRFDVWEFQVEGSTLLDAAAIGRTVYGFLGPERTIDDVEGARSALESAFRDAGYGTVLVNIPEQDVENGVVRLEVIEGKVERLHVVGSRYFALGRIRASVPALAAGRVPVLPKVQEQLSKLNRVTPDRVVTPVLKPGRRTGDVEVELQVEDKLPLHGSVELNDQFTRDTTRTRLNASLRYDNLWQREHSLGISYQLTPQDPQEVKVLSGTYLMRPAWTDALIALYAVKSDSDVVTLSGTGGGVGVLGKGVITGARFVKPLPVVSGIFHNFTAGLDYKDFEDTIAPTGDDGFVTPISYVKFVAGYGGFKSFERTTFNYNLETNFGVRAFGNTEKEFENKRFQAKPNFVLMRTNARLEAPAPRESLVRAEVAGQVASGAIISNEQFNLGGIDSVRGYVETQVLVDDAVQGRLEWVSPSLSRHVGLDWLTQFNFLVFGDAAHGRTLDPLPGQAASANLAGIGLGLEIDTSVGIGSNIAWAYPLIGNGDIRPGESRLHFGFAYEF